MSSTDPFGPFGKVVGDFVSAAFYNTFQKPIGDAVNSATNAVSDQNPEWSMQQSMKETQNLMRFQLGLQQQQTRFDMGYQHQKGADDAKRHTAAEGARSMYRTT